MLKLAAACGRCPPGPPPLAAADQTFVTTVAGVDAGEIQVSQLAATKARSARVKAFANQMVTDHTAVGQQFGTLIQSKGATPDATPPQMLSDDMTKLQADSPAAFDRDYMRDQVGVQQAAVQAFQDEIANGQDADLKAVRHQHAADAAAAPGDGAAPVRHPRTPHAGSRPLVSGRSQACLERGAGAILPPAFVVWRGL